MVKIPPPAFEVFEERHACLLTSWRLSMFKSFLFIACATTCATIVCPSVAPGRESSQQHQAINYEALIAAVALGDALFVQRELHELSQLEAIFQVISSSSARLVRATSAVQGSSDRSAKRS